RAVAREALGLPDDTELVVQVGRIERGKSQLALVDAVAMLRESRPRLVAWIVGGTGEPDYEELVRERIAAEGLGDTVRLCGERDDVPRVLAAADVFAMPSAMEGLSLAVVEALVAGTPSVLTRTGDADFLLGESDPGFTGDVPGALVEGPEIHPETI